MKILITGAKGFVGRNLCATLGTMEGHELLAYDVDTPPALLDEYAAKAEFVFHLAGVNRPKEAAEFMSGNFGFTGTLLEALRRQGSRAPIALSSSIQAALDNPYGESKRAGEELLRRYGEERGLPVYLYRFPNLFGKWCRPFYNSVVATFCHQITHGDPLTINDPATTLSLSYIDDVCAELLRALTGAPTRGEDGFCTVAPIYRRTLGQIAALLEGFRESRVSLQVPDLGEPFSRALYATYLSHLPEDAFAYPLVVHADARGSFTELLRSPERGQVSVNISRPGITKGNHWHHSKNEKFIVLSGEGVIRFRKLDEERVIEYPVSGARLEVVDIPTGYTHSIVNLGQVDMVTLMWASECFDPQTPDTYPLPV